MHIQRVSGSKRRLSAKIWTAKLNNRSRRRLNWEQMEPQGGFDVVKGISHRVIVVKSPDKYFEEAIFVIREDVLLGRGADRDTVLKEARRVANSYARGTNKPGKRFLSKLSPPLFAAAGAAATGVAWLALRLLGV